MKASAIVLKDDSNVPQFRNIAKLLDFLGVDWCCTSVQEFVQSPDIDKVGTWKARILCSANSFTQLFAHLQNRPDGREWWRERVQSAFVFGGEDTAELQQLARMLTNDSGLVAEIVKCTDTDIVFSHSQRQFCGVMSGVRICVSNKSANIRVMRPGSEGNATNIISVQQGVAFLKCEHDKVPVFLLAGQEIIDLDAELPTGIFDVRDHALSAVPIVLYIKWAFPTGHWFSPEATACVVIDDPLLKARYGFVSFKQLLSVMKLHRFSTNIAFIPWNWQRTAPEIARLFNENPMEFSVSIHGCDHTRGEFGSNDRDWILGQSKQALARMAKHHLITGIRHDRVMVFPQGVFSSAAMSALNQSGFIAAVNNDTLSNDPNSWAIKVSDVWDVAVMRYDNFPLYTRRYPWEGVANFAFEMLLGKPCLVVIHHDFCSDGCERLVKFVEQLNNLNGVMRWCNLTEVVRSGYRQRFLASDVIEVEMYGAEMRLRNPTTQSLKFCIKKRQSSISGIRGVFADNHELEWEQRENRLLFEYMLPANEEVIISVKCNEDTRAVEQNVRWKYRVKTMLRRYLSEFRDNYVLCYLPNILTRFVKVN